MSDETKHALICLINPILTAAFAFAAIIFICVKSPN